jgi:hypothetical protein
MIFDGQFPVCLFNILLGSLFGHSQHLVVVSVFHRRYSGNKEAKDNRYYGKSGVPPLVNSQILRRFARNINTFSSNEKAFVFGR